VQLLKHDFVETILRRYTLNSLEDLYAAIGYGGISAGRIIPRLRDEYIRSMPEEERTRLGYRITATGQVVASPQTPLLSEDSAAGTGKSSKSKSKGSTDHGITVKGIENCLVRLSRCCSPVPGDKIIGFVTRGKGVAVHRMDCSNIRNLLQSAGGSAVNAEKASRLIDVAWARDSQNTSYQVELRILAHDRRHLLADVSNAIADEKVSIISGQMTAMKDVTATLVMTIEVTSQNQFDRVLGRIKAVRDVIDVRRGH
jgi:GTP pyrophosphokinase